MGILFINDEDFYKEEYGYSFNLSDQLGVGYVDLIDFDNDNNSELFILYFSNNNEYIYEIYNYENEAKKLYSKRNSLAEDFSLDFIIKDNKTYLKDNKNYKTYYNEGGYELITNENYISIEHGTIYEESFKHTYSIDELKSVEYRNVNNEVTVISEEDHLQKIDKYNGDYQTIISQNFPIGTMNNFRTTLIQRDVYNDINNLRKNILEASSVNYSFNNITKDISKVEYDKITNYIKIFLQDFVRLIDYDKNNVNEAYLLNFVFNLYEYTDIEGLKRIEDVDSNGEYVTSLSKDEINKKLEELLDITIDLNEGDIIEYKNNDNTTKFIVKEDNVERKGISQDRGSVEYIPILDNIYEIQKNYYLVEISEDMKLIDGKIEKSLAKFYTIINKNTDGRYQLLKIQDESFENEEVIKSYIQRESITEDKKTNTDNNIDNKEKSRNNENYKQQVDETKQANNESINNHTFIIISIVLVIIGVYFIRLLHDKK